MTSLPRPNSTTNIHDSSGYAGGAAQIPQANKNIDKSRPNSTTNIRNSSGPAEGAAQIPSTNDINDKSHPNSTMHIQNSSGDAKGAAQIRQTQLMTSLIPQFFWLPRRRCPNSTGNPINDNLIQIRPRTITIHRVTPEALPKFNM
jgi:hypothetical protein